MYIITLNVLFSMSIQRENKFSAPFSLQELDIKLWFCSSDRCQNTERDDGESCCCCVPTNLLEVPDTLWFIQELRWTSPAPKVSIKQEYFPFLRLAQSSASTLNINPVTVLTKDPYPNLQILIRAHSYTSETFWQAAVSTRPDSPKHFNTRGCHRHSQLSPSPSHACPRVFQLSDGICHIHISCAVIHNVVAQFSGTLPTMHRL